MTRFRLLCAALCVLALNGVSRGQDSPTATEDELRTTIDLLRTRLESLERQSNSNTNTRTADIGGSDRRSTPHTVVRLYDVSDLFVVAPSYPAQLDSDLVSERPLFPPTEDHGTATGFAGGMVGGMGGGGMGGGMGGAATATHQPMADRRISIDQLIDTITATIEPDAWDDVGGEGSIKALGNALVVSTTQGIHQQISELIRLLRSRWGTPRLVRLHAYWLWQDEADIESLMRGEFEPDVAVPDAVPEGLWIEWLERSAERPGYRASTQCYNGQTVHILAGSQHVFIRGLTPVVGGETQPAYSPQVAVLQQGAVLQVTPVVHASGNYITLDIQSRVSKLVDVSSVDVSPEALRNGPQSVAGAIDRPVVQVQRLSTTTRLPVDQVTRIGGMTFDNGLLSLYIIATVEELQSEPLVQP